MDEACGAPDLTYLFYNEIMELNSKIKNSVQNTGFGNIWL